MDDDRSSSLQSNRATQIYMPAHRIESERENVCKYGEKMDITRTPTEYE
jgi:hypothetical protein